MSVLIRGIEMPKNCFTCRFKNLEICYEGCPLIEVPPHGRLIDADALVISIGPIIPEDSLIPCTIESAKFLMFKHIAYANTIIEAEVET